MNYYTSLSMHKNNIEDAKLVRPVIYNSATEPTTGAPGELYYNTVDNNIYQYNGTAWIPLKTLAQVYTTLNKVEVDGVYITDVCTYRGLFSTTDTYNVGDIVKYTPPGSTSAQSYVCRLRVASPGPFIASQWEVLGAGGSVATTVEIKKEAVPDTGYAATYYLSTNGSTTPSGEKINIPKDFLVRRASLQTVKTFVPSEPYVLDQLVQCTSDVYRLKVAGSYATQADLIAVSDLALSGTGHANEKYFVFVINAKDDSDTESALYVSLADLAGVYVGGDGIDITGSTISAKYDGASIKKDLTNQLYVGTHVPILGEDADISLTIATDGLKASHSNYLKDSAGSAVTADVDTYVMPYVKMDKQGHIKQYKDGTVTVEKQTTPTAGSYATYKIKTGSEYVTSAIEDAKITADDTVTPTTGYSKKIDFYQGDSGIAANKFASIDIPKDNRLVGAEVKIVRAFNDPLGLQIGDLVIENTGYYDYVYYVKIPPVAGETFSSWSVDPTKCFECEGIICLIDQQVFEFRVNEKYSVSTPDYIYASVEGVGGGDYTAGNGITISTSNVISATQMQGATATADGRFGMVPRPYMADKDKFLKGDGTWAAASGVEYLTGTLADGSTSTTITVPTGKVVVSVVMFQNNEQVFADVTINPATGVVTISSEEAVTGGDINITLSYTTA